MNEPPPWPLKKKKGQGFNWYILLLLVYLGNSTCSIRYLIKLYLISTHAVIFIVLCS